jgi:hypothetical protein
MSDFIKDFISRREKADVERTERSDGRERTERTERSEGRGGRGGRGGAQPGAGRPTKEEDGIIHTYKDIIRLAPRKRIVHEYFRQRVQMLNIPEE